MLSKRAQGREWIALYERAQFGLVAAILKKPKLLTQAAALLKSATGWLQDEGAQIPQHDIRRALDLIEQLRSVIKDRGLRRDLSAVTKQVKAARGRTVREAFSALLRVGPVGSATAARVKTVPKAKSRNSL